MRIAMIVPTMDVGGMEVLVLGLSRALRARGHHVEILCTQAVGALAPRIAALGIPVDVAEAPGLKTIVFPTALAARLRQGRFDVVHSHSGITAKAARAARLAGVPGVVNTMHGFAHGWGMVDHVLQGVGGMQADILVGCSADTEAYMRRLLPFRSRDVRLVNNGLDVEQFLRDTGEVPFREELGLPASARVLGTVARLDPVKNQQLLIEALEHLDPSWHLVLVGDGVTRPVLEAAVAARGLGDRVHLVGARAVSARIYRAFDVFALSSLSEAMPMTVLEAFAAGVPVVASAVGGLPTLLQDGKTGRLYPSGDAAALAAAVTAIVTNPADTARQIDAATAQLHAAHTLEAMVTTYEALYAEAAAT